jgi:signal transduction histidine kinase
MATRAVARHEPSTTRAPVKHLRLAHPDEMAARRASLYRRQVRHDIQHQLSTLILLSSLLETGKDVGSESRRRAGQLLAELKWLRDLVAIFEHELDEGTDTDHAMVTRLDLVATDVLRAFRMSSGAQITLEAAPASARVDRLACWRAFRNLVGNAVQAAGEGGAVTVRVRSVAGQAILEVEDSGPGFDPTASRPTAQGLRIVADLARSHGGKLEIGPASPGRCKVALLLPEAGWGDQ